jgi:CHAT domain-containing protein
VGKAARLREERRLEREQPLKRSAASEYAVRAMNLDSEGELREMIEKEPRVLDSTVPNLLDEGAEYPGFRAASAAVAKLLRRTATQGVSEAWAEFEDGRRRRRDAEERLDHMQDGVERSVRDQDWQVALPLIDEALGTAEEAGNGVIWGFLNGEKMKALLGVESGNRSGNLESALECGELALAMPFEGNHSIDVLMTLGGVYMERLEGDSRSNKERSIELTGLAMQEAERTGDRDLISLLQNNLANAFHRREEGDRVENLRAARDLCLRALEWRSPERNVVDWGYTQITLGVILESLANAGDGEIGDTITVNEQLLSEAHRGIPEWMLAKAHGEIGTINWRQANAIYTLQHVDPDELEIDEDEMSFITPEDQQRMEDHFAAAEPHLREGLARLDPNRHPIEYARIANRLAKLLDRQEEGEEEAIDVARDALRFVTAENAPEVHRDLAWTVGNRHAVAGEWQEAAGAYSAALESAQLLFHARHETEDRNSQVSDSGNLARWASVVLARAGRDREAVVALEAGRARELRRRIAPDPTQGLPEDLLERYAEASQALRASALGAASADAGRTFQRLLAEIRERPGFERFGTDPEFEEIAAAVEPDWPFLYVNPTPWGIQYLLLHDPGDGEVRLDATVDERVNSHETMMKIFFDIEGENDPKDISYLAAIGGWRDEDDAVERALDGLLPWLGENIARRAAELLKGTGASGVSLVSCGSLGIAPLQAAVWEEDGAERCLFDNWAVRFLPSALVGAGCIQKADAASRRDARVRALGDPTPQAPLPAARAEAKVVVDLLGGSPEDLAIDAEANSSFLAGTDAETTHLHLACHASADLVDYTDSVIHLHDGPVPATELGAIVPCDPRLTVVSACQSAIPGMLNQLDEVFALSTAFLAAGSACVIAPLWSVDDRATAILMVKVYEVLVNDPAPDPSSALREAQLWMCDLDAPGAKAFLADYPEVAVAVRKPREGGGNPGLRSPGGAATDVQPDFGPYHWAGFIATGA